MGTYAVTGSARGIGGAIRARLEAGGHTVIGVDLAGQEVEADVSTPAGRNGATDAVADRARGTSACLVVWAGLRPTFSRTETLAPVTCFGPVELLAALRPRR